MILYFIDEILRMFHTDAHGERFACQRQAFPVEQVVGIVCRMSRGPDDRICRNPAGLFRKDPLYPVVVDAQIGDFGSENDFAAASGDGGIHMPYDVRQFVGADVWMSLVQNLFVCTVIMEPGEDAAGVAALGRPGEQFAIGERAGAAPSETVIRFCIEPQPPREGSDVFLAFSHVFATLQYDGSQAVLDEPERGEQSGGSAPDHHHGAAGVDVLVTERLLSGGRVLLVRRKNGDGAENPDTLPGPRIDGFPQDAGARRFCGLCRLAQYLLPKSGVCRFLR